MEPTINLLEIKDKIMAMFVVACLWQLVVKVESGPITYSEAMEVWRSMTYEEQDEYQTRNHLLIQYKLTLRGKAYG